MLTHINRSSRSPTIDYYVPELLQNMELHLERRVSEKRVYPAININKSGTRREELLVNAAELQKMWILRKILHPMDELAAIEFLIDRMKDTKTNNEFFDAMKRQ